MQTTDLSFLPSISQILFTVQITRHFCLCVLVYPHPYTWQSQYQPAGVLVSIESGWLGTFLVFVQEQWVAPTRRSLTALVTPDAWSHTHLVMSELHSLGRGGVVQLLTKYQDCIMWIVTWMENHCCLKSTILRPYKPWCQGRPFELFWSSAGCGPHLWVGCLWVACQLPGLISLRLNLHLLRNHLIWSEYFTELEGNFYDCVCICVTLFKA